MEVNFNNLRKQAIYSYEKLAEKLNYSIEEWNKETNEKGIVHINANEIQEDMDDLRGMICAIASVYEPEDDNFKDVYSEVFPNENDSMLIFNEEK